MHPNIGIKPEHLTEVARILNVFLADEFILYLKTKNAHWNIEGSDFQEKHKFFETQYQQLEDIVDNVAERIRFLGHYAVASLKDYLELTHLTEESREKNNSAGFVSDLLSDHESIIIRLRANLKPVADELSDAGTADFLTSLIERHEKMAWILRAQLN